MDRIERAFSFMFEDKEWLQKMLIGAAFVLLSILLIGIPFLIGYVLEVARRSAAGEPLPLPNWDNMGQKFGRGFLFFVIVLLYSLPAIVLMFIPCLGILLYMIYVIALYLAMPYIVVRFARSGNFSEAFDFRAIIGFMKENLANSAIALLLGIVFGILAAFGIIAIVIGIFFTAFWAQLATHYVYGQVVYTAEKKQGMGGAVPAA